MKREIEFRGLNLSGQWCYGLLTVLKNKIPYRELEKGSYISNSEGVPFAFNVIPLSVGQFTGVKDKNGIKIYEGDILKGKKQNSPVAWSENLLQWVAGDLMLWAFSDKEIVGNIYEKLELKK